MDKGYENRAQTKIKTLFDENIESSTTRFYLSPSDHGVRRNLGKNGARYAPEAIMNSFKNLTLSSNHRALCLFEKVVSSQELEKSDFNQAQLKEIDSITSACSQKVKKWVHLGGGHDHVYPLLKSVEKCGYKKIYVLNIDAHCDTRNDSEYHSGTPFRQFDHDVQCEFKLTQFGIHPFANSESTLKQIQNPYQIITFNQAANMSWLEKEKLFSDLFDSWDEDAFFLLSLDCDAIDGSQMQGVSAVNHNGFFTREISEIVQWFKDLETNATKGLGIYEYNPLRDNSSNSGARFLASLIYNFIA